MRSALLGLAALMTATAAQSAVQINFNSPSGNVGNSHTYTSGSYSVTAYGYSNFNFGSNTGTAAALYDKSAGGDENGVGLAGDPSGDNEIWYANDNFATIPAVIVDVSSLLAGGATLGQFEMGSTTAHEEWIIGGFDGTSWFEILTGTTEGSFVNLPGWGTYTKYAFVSGGTNFDGRRPGNVLLSALSFTPGVPEPGTWAMMLLGFGAMGLAFRRKPREASLA